MTTHVNNHHRDGQRQRTDSGYALISGAICLLVLLGFVGLAIDLGYLEHVRRRIQTAADAGAIAGAQELLRGRTEDQIIAASKNDSAINHFTDGERNTTVTVNHPPLSGRYAGDMQAVEVIVRQTEQPIFFIGAIGGTRKAVSARAVAHLGSGDGCLFALNRTESNSLLIDGGSDFSMDCGIMVDSTNPRAINVNGCSGDVDASMIGVAGGFDDRCNVLDPRPTTGLLPVSDPLDGLAAPTVSACDHTSQVRVPSPSFPPAADGKVYLNPGTYCGGISVSSGSVVFAPGNYLINGGGLSISGGTLNGDGVMFYDTGTVATYKAISIAGNATSTLSAPTDGTYQGILFFSCVMNASGVCDRNLAPKASETTSSIGGTSGSNFAGVLYFPKSTLKYAGTPGSSGSNLAIIADKVEISGTVNFQGDFSALPGGSPIKIAVLGE